MDVHVDGMDGEKAVVFCRGRLRVGNGVGRRDGDDTGTFASVSLLEVVGGDDGEQKLHLDCVGWVGIVT